VQSLSHHSGDKTVSVSFGTRKRYVFQSSPFYVWDYSHVYYDLCILVANTCNGDIYSVICSLPSGGGAYWPMVMVWGATIALRQISSPRTQLLAARCECLHLIKINCLALWLDESAHAWLAASCEELRARTGNPPLVY
jgi:hypothetical protein